MRKVVSLFVQYPFYANIFIAIVLIAGVMGFLNMKKSFFPESSEKEIFVMVTYPGASPKEMEEGITVRVEESIRGIAGIKEVNSTSSENFARIQITSTGEYDIDETLMEVKNAVDGITSFPVLLFLIWNESGLPPHQIESARLIYQGYLVRLPWISHQM